MNTEWKAKLIAFYLPQYHQIPENDAWWGNGFTEWTNVAKARPLFRGHKQPRVPGELGYYDLLSADTRMQQADLARMYGIHGFCYWHYWFEGRRLLEQPLEEVLCSGEPDLPFCLAWANETWSRRWDGREHDILVRQTYGGDDDARAHMRWLSRALSDPRAIRIDEKPLLLIYRPFDIPDLPHFLSVWRDEAHTQNVGDLFLVGIETGFSESRDHREVGFDALLKFQPDFTRIRSLQARKNGILSRLFRQPPVPAYRYKDAASICMQEQQPPHPRFDCIVPRWDNAPRKARQGFVLYDDDPTVYEEWLRFLIQRSAQTQERSQPVVFLNAWNEWGEGNYLEPDLEYGRAYLEATQRANALDG